MPTEQEIADAFEALDSAHITRNNARVLLSQAQVQQPNFIEHGQRFSFSEVEQVSQWDVKMLNATETLAGANRQFDAAKATVEALIPESLMQRVKNDNAPIIVKGADNQYLALYMQDNELAVLRGNDTNAVYSGIVNYEQAKQRNARGFGGLNDRLNSW